MILENTKQERKMKPKFHVTVVQCEQTKHLNSNKEDRNGISWSGKFKCASKEEMKKIRTKASLETGAVNHRVLLIASVQ